MKPVVVLRVSLEHGHYLCFVQSSQLKKIILIAKYFVFAGVLFFFFELIQIHKNSTVQDYVVIELTNDNLK